MNQIFAGAAALSLTLILWVLGRKPTKATLHTIDTSNLDAVNLPRNALFDSKLDFLQKKLPISPTQESKSNWSPPKNPQLRIKLQRQLRKLIASSPEDRLTAINIAGEWGHPSILPLVKRGLKDSDSQVIKAAAKIMEKYRGKTQIKNSLDKVRHPRNVALMR